jgi:hypothetical protein
MSKSRHTVSFGTKNHRNLLLYGNKNEEFEDVFWEQTPKVKLKLLLKKREYKVYQRIYLVCKKMR